MVMLSTLSRFEISADEQIQGRFVDLSVGLLDDDYPPVTHLFFRNQNKKLMRLPWRAVQSLDLAAGRITVNDIELADEVSLESVADDVLLQRDVLDALVLDLQNRRATRANDLQLEEVDGNLNLHAADTSVRAVLRRITRGLYSQVRESALYDWKYVEFLRGDPHAVQNEAGSHLRITRLPPGEIAQLAELVPYLHAAELITLLPDPKAVDALEAMSDERQLQVFEELDEEQAIRLLAIMAPDVAADLVGRLQTNTMKRYIERLPKKQCERIIELLRYPDDTVGGIMTNDVAFIRCDITTQEARIELRERLKSPDFAYFIYIVENDENMRLRGVISLRDLVGSDDGQKVEEIMDPYVTTLNALDHANVGAYRVINSHLAAMPVTGNQGQLLGIVTVDAAIAQVAPSNWGTQAPRIFS
jgi:CBS domain-containing protein